MELRFVDIPFGRLVLRCRAEAAAEGELPLPEGRRAEDTEVLASSSALSLGRAYMAGGEAIVEGRVKTTLLCRDRSGSASVAAGETGVGENAGASSALGGGEVFSFSATAPFRYSAPVSGGKDTMTVEAACELEQAEVTVASALSFRAVVSIDLEVTESPAVKALMEVKDGGAEFLTRKLTSAFSYECGAGEARISQAFACPEARSALFPIATAEVRSVHAGGGTAMVDILAHISFIAVTSDGELETERFTFPQTVEFPLQRETTERCGASVEVESAYARVNADGMATVELVLAARIYSWREDSVAIPTDAYMPGAMLVAKRERATLVCRSSARRRRVDSRERIPIPSSLPLILRAVACNGVVSTTDVSASNGNIHIEGIMSLKIAYQSDAGIVTFDKQAPFLADVESDMENALVSARILSLTASAAGNSVDVVSSLELTVSPYMDADILTVAGMEKLEAVKRPRALTVCFTGDSDSAFAIGKRYMIAEDAIKDISEGCAAEGRVMMFLS